MKKKLPVVILIAGLITLLAFHFLTSNSRISPKSYQNKYYSLIYPQDWVNSIEHIGNSPLATSTFTKKDNSQYLKIEIITSLNIPAGPAPAKTQALNIDGSQGTEEINGSEMFLFIRRSGLDYYISAHDSSENFTQINSILSSIKFRN